MNDRRKYEEVPLLITNPSSKVTYRRGNFLGKGGFARCYEFKNTSTGEILAGKVVSKTMLKKPHHREKMFQEITIHKSLSHQYIVALHSYFEDESNMYIILELCRKRSLMEMHKRRKTLTLPEVRYFMKQIVTACKYMHDNKVIHRDLKLGNLFINDTMEIKVGDFGLATRVNTDGERKMTLCGTPNYIAPEILTKTGHSYEVDIWSLGCIMYTLLVGYPPFETSSLKNTYQKIKKCDYYLPSGLDHSARVLIQQLLHPNPESRPNAGSILKNDFLASDYIPARLPASCLTTQPRFPKNISMPLVRDVTRMDRNPLSNKLNVYSPILGNGMPSNIPVKARKIEEIFEKQTLEPSDYHLTDLIKLLQSVISSQPEKKFNGQIEDAQDPSSVPFVWISKWVDYTDKYGIGYQLCDNSIGVLFNDASHLILLQDGETLQYIEKNNEEHYFKIENHPSHMSKKITLLKYFNNYMTDNLVKAGESAKPREGDELASVPYLRAWFRTKSAIIFHLTNGTYQANFFKDHTKVILCPIMGAVSLIDEHQNLTVYSMKLIEKYGCTTFLATHLSYAKKTVEKLYREIKTI